MTDKKYDPVFSEHELTKKEKEVAEKSEKPVHTEVVSSRPKSKDDLVEKPTLPVGASTEEKADIAAANPQGVLAPHDASNTDKQEQGRLLGIKNELVEKGVASERKHFVAGRLEPTKQANQEEVKKVLDDMKVILDDYNGQEGNIPLGHGYWGLKRQLQMLNMR